MCNRSVWEINMATETRTITITSDVELENVLDAAEDALVRLIRGETTFVDHRYLHNDEEDIWAGYDADAVRKSLAEMAGAWADLDTDKMIEDLYRAREEGSRPPDRPRWPT